MRSDARDRADKIGPIALAHPLLPADPSATDGKAAFTDLEVGKAVRQSATTVGVPFQLHQRVTHGSAPKLTGTIVLQRAPTTGAGWRVTAVDVGREVGKVPSQGGPPPSRAPLGLWIGTLAIGLVIVVGGSALIRWAGRGSVTGSSASPDPGRSPCWR